MGDPIAIQLNASPLTIVPLLAPIGPQGFQGAQGPQGSGSSAGTALTTGVLSVSTIGITSSDITNTHFDIGAVEAVVVNSSTNPAAPTITFVHYAGATNVLDTLIASCDTTYLYLDSSGVLHQRATDLSNTERRTLVRVGWLDHPGRTEIEDPEFEPDPAYDAGLQLMDFIESHGSFNIRGNVYIAGGHNLTLARSEGAVFDNGSSFASNRSDPHVVESVENPAVSFIGYYRGSGEVWVSTAERTSIDPEHYDDGSGILASVPLGKFTAQFVSYYALTDSTDIQYGQDTYDSIGEAYSHLTDPVAIDPYNEADVFRGWIIVQQGCTDLTDPNGALFVNGDGVMLGRITGNSMTGAGGLATGPQGPQGFQGYVGAQGPQGFQGYVGAQGPQGFQGYQGATGAGTQGNQGNQGAQGFQGYQGAQGNQGNQGFQGTRGYQGYQGTQGATGSGAQGNQGYQGTQGSQGVQGATGAGTQGNQGNQGAQGFQGYQGATGSGAQGNQGYQGTQGSQGFQGATGAGTQGNQGNQGVQGFQGYQGATGSGAQGNQGYQGTQGSQGFQGATGAGTQGNQGNQGAQGAQGYQGTQGYQGNQGYQGTNGVQIISGTGAPPSASGLSDGTVYLQYSDSASVLQGPQGYQGYQGSQGFQGATGAGTQGNQGDQGTQGTQGNQGATGVATYYIQGNQQTLTAQTVTNIGALITPALVNSGVYHFRAIVGVQMAAGTQGCQFAPQCSVAGATVWGMGSGSQGAQGVANYRNHWQITTQGQQGPQAGMVAGLGEEVLEGIMTMPASGSPQLMIQCKGVQASVAGYIKPSSFMYVTRVS
jgi:hypothetical protein